MKDNAQLVEALVKAADGALQGSRTCSLSLICGLEYGLEQTVRETAAYKELRLRWSGDHFDEALRRSGLYANVAAGVQVLPSAVQQFLERFDGARHPSFGAIEVYGGRIDETPIDLGSGFLLKRFTEMEIRGWNPPLRREQLDPYSTSHYAFVFSERAHALEAAASRMNFDPARPREVRHDPFWAAEWWKPFLVLNLFQPRQVVAGVRLNVTPGWRIDRDGEFEGEYCETPDPETGESAGVYWDTLGGWHDFEQRRPELAEFASIVTRVLVAMTSSKEETPFRVAVRAYLRALKRIGRIQSREVDAADLEDVLFDLIRAADGLGGYIGKSGKANIKHYERTAWLAGISTDTLLKDCYNRRTEYAHGHGESPIKTEDALRLVEIVQSSFIGYLGTIEEVGFKRDELVEKMRTKSPQSMTAIKLRQLARPVTR